MCGAMPACQVSGGALLRAKMMQVHFMVARGKHLPARTLSGQNYFPALATFPVQENKKVIFLLLVSACRDSGRRQSCPLAGRAGPSWRAGPAAPVYAAAKISAAEGGKLQGNARPRKILEATLPDPANLPPHPFLILKRGCRTRFPMVFQLRHVQGMHASSQAARPQSDCENTYFSAGGSQGGQRPRGAAI